MKATQEQIVIVGKGGVGKSLIAGNLSAIFARKGRRVLHVGCDPKHDSSRVLGILKKVPTVVERLALCPEVNLKDVLAEGTRGIHCIEAGGPAPGRGCAGRGISKMLELLDEFDVVRKYSTIVFDLLGDVVCGGFAAPLRKGFGRKVIIVTTDELMSLWSANNISKMVLEYASNGVCLAGLVVNSRTDHPIESARIRRFAKKIDTKILQVLPWDPSNEKAQVAGTPISLYKKNSPLSQGLSCLADAVIKLNPRRQPPPRPMDDDQFENFLKG